MYLLETLALTPPVTCEGLRPILFLYVTGEFPFPATDGDYPHQMEITPVLFMSHLISWGEEREERLVMETLLSSLEIAPGLETHQLMKCVWLPWILVI